MQDFLMAGTEESYREIRCFNCYRRSRYQEDFNPYSFLRAGEICILSKEAKNLKFNGPKDVLLFERKFDEGSAIHHIKVLFRLARKELKMLQDAVDRGVVNKDQNPRIISEAECEEFRRHVVELLNYVRVYYLSLPLEMNSAYYRLKADILSEMSSFCKSLPALTSYGDVYVQLSSRKDSYRIYHMYHLILDVHWYYISILVILKNYADSLNDSDDTVYVFPLESERVKESGILEKHIQSLLSELLSIAISRFKKIKSGDPREKSPFACKCIEEIWVLLQFLGDSLADARAGKSFWNQLNLLLEKVASENSEVNNDIHATKCSDPTAFSLWLILHLSHLYGYDQQGEFVGQKSGRAKNNYYQLEKSLLSFMNQNSLPGCESKVELLMRRYIHISSIICLERWWKPLRSDIVMIFWEYFHRRLNMSLLLPGSGPASLQQISKSVLGMLARVKERIREEETTELEEDSFCVFLKFLGRYLTHCHKEEGAREWSSFRLWQQMRGRLFSKLGPTKVKGLSQLGLQRLINLFLTLCVTADVKEVGKKMLDVLYLLSPWDPSGRDIAKRELIMQAHLSLLYLHVQHEIDVAEIAKPLIVEVQRACSELSSVSKLNEENVFSHSWKLATAHTEGLRKILSMFVEGIHEIVSSSLRMCLSEYTLIGPWISSWLKICSTTASRRLMDTILSILEKLETLRKSVLQANEHISHPWEGSTNTENIDSGGGTVHMKEHWNKMEAALVENVLPIVKSLCFDADPPFQVADIAAYFTLASCNGGSDNFTHLFTYFAASDSVNYRISRRYMCNLAANEKFMKSLSLRLNGYQDIIIQVWIRSSLLSIDESYIGELEDLTHTVVKLQKVSNILNIESNSDSIIPRTIESLEEFLMFIAERYDSYQTAFEKSKFREQCYVYFSKIDKIIGPHIRNPTSQTVVMRIYDACGMMVLYCGNIMYIKGKPNCVLPSVISHLILPAHIYNPEPKLHKFILSASRKSLIMFARGLAKLSPNTDPYIKRCLRDMITHYLPCLYQKNLSFSSTPHPFLVSFETKSPEDEILQRMILDILSSVFLTSKRKVPHAHADKALEILQEILEIGRKRSIAFEDGKELLKLIATCSLPGLLEFLLGVDENLEEWTKALNLISKIVICLEEACKSGNLINEIIDGLNAEEIGNSSKEEETWREVFCSAAKKFFQQHLAFSASAVFRVMQRLTNLNPKIVNASMGDLEEELKKVELRRGVGYDPVLRNSLERLRSFLEAAMKTNKSNLPKVF